MGRRRYYAFVDAVIPSEPDSNRSREILLLDCIDAETFDGDGRALDQDESLSLIRVMSTRRRFNEDFGLAPVEEGEWLELTIDKNRGSPRAWVMPALSNYVSEAGSNIRSIAKLPEPGEDGPAAIIAARLSRECDLRDAKRFGESAADFLALLHISSGSHLEIRAVDVGHASCNLFLTDGVPVGYFDVGAPLCRNQSSFHGRLCHKPPTSGFVILSHWDFDHFDLGRRRRELQQLYWLAPDQPVGPNTLKFQKKLGGNLRFFPGPLVYPFMALRPGLSTKPKDRIGTGYSMRIEVDGEVIVLTGDCGYDNVDPATLDGATAITIPHHGGRSAAPPPAANGDAIAVASYGKPNCYRHPCEEYLKEHDSLGWNVRRTAAHRLNGGQRGFRTLYG
jgi:hypothetical protein